MRGLNRSKTSKYVDPTRDNNAPSRTMRVVSNKGPPLDATLVPIVAGICCRLAKLTPDSTSFSLVLSFFIVFHRLLIPFVTKPLILACLLGSVAANAQPPQEARYLSFQIFTYGPNPRIATLGEGSNPIARFPDNSTLRDYIDDIKRRIGSVGSPQTRLAVMLGPLSFDHTDADVAKFIALGFDLAIETGVAVGFHIDDSMFWGRRKDLWSDPANVEAMDWDGTPCTARRLDWQTSAGAKPDAAPPQMCFNSKAILREVAQRSSLIGRSIQAGVTRLQQLKNP
jgi:hypothetical protein